MATVYKILTAEQYAAAGDLFTGSPDDERDGFIHLSTAEQLDGTIERHFAGQAGLVVLSFEPDRLGAALRWEPSRDGALFPHLYGPLPVTAAESITFRS